MQTAFKSAQFITLPAKKKSVSLLAFWGLAIMGFAHQKGENALFGHHAPMDWNMVAWIIIFLIAFGPLAIYIWLF